MTEDNINYILAWYKDVTFANGFQVLKKITNDNYDGTFTITYKYGDWHREMPDKEWDLDKINLEFQPLTIDYKPTVWECFKKWLFKKDYPTTMDNRPIDNSVVIAKYGNSIHYEMIEYHNRRWISELYFPVKPDGFAYIPQYIISETTSEHYLTRKKYLDLQHFLP